MVKNIPEIIKDRPFHNTMVIVPITGLIINKREHITVSMAPIMIHTQPGSLNRCKAEK
jgi:hypothetical protein